MDELVEDKTKTAVKRESMINPGIVTGQTPAIGLVPTLDLIPSRPEAHLAFARNAGKPSRVNSFGLY
jgi:hypothetical protein